MPTIATWNTRGNPENKAKKEEGLKLLVKTCDIVLLQECGGIDLPETGHFLYGPQAGAGNNRCSTCIISKQEIEDPAIHANFSSGRCLLEGRVDGYIIATIHSSAGGDGAADARQAMRILLAKYGQDTKIILGGDFNVTPEEILNYSDRRHTINLGTSDRTQLVSCSYPSSSTFIDGKVLDFFIHTDKVRSHDIETRQNLADSDHYPVKANFSTRLSAM